MTLASAMKTSWDSEELKDLRVRDQSMTEKQTDSTQVSS